MKKSTKTIAIVEDDSALRKSLLELLSDAQGWKVIASFPNAELALPELLKQPPDVVLMDIQLPGMSGIECAAALKNAHPTLHVLMITVFDDTDRVFDALAAGASGYLLKRDVPTRLQESLDDILTGGSPISSNVARKLFQHFQKDIPSLPEADYKLTPREQEILDLLVQAMLYKEIASHLGIGLETVRYHLHNIYRKLQVRTRTEAVVKYLSK